VTDKLMELAVAALRDIVNALPIGPPDSVSTWFRLADAHREVALTALRALAQQENEDG
jgi:hypothetical protein